MIGIAGENASVCNFSSNARASYMGIIYYYYYYHRPRPGVTVWALVIVRTLQLCGGIVQYYIILCWLPPPPRRRWSYIIYLPSYRTHAEPTGDRFSFFSTLHYIVCYIFIYNRRATTYTVETDKNRNNCSTVVEHNKYNIVMYVYGRNYYTSLLVILIESVLDALE